MVSEAHKNLDFIIDRIDKGPFSIIRYGDGEICSMEGIRQNGENNHGDKYFKELSSGLLRSWRNPKKNIMYFVSHLHGSAKWMHAKGKLKGNKTAEACVRYCKQAPSIFEECYDTHLFMESIREGSFYPFIKKCTDKNLVFVGPKFLERCVVKHEGHIETPIRNAFKKIDIIKENILRYAASSKSPVIFSLSAGMVSGIIVNDLFDKIGDKHYLFDLGSVWDIFCNIRSRTGYCPGKKAEDFRTATWWEENVLKNYPPLKKFPSEGETVDFYWHNCPNKGQKPCQCSKIEGGF